MSSEPQATSPSPGLDWIRNLGSRVPWETLIFTVIILLVILSRFADLGTRVMSHDETQHTYFSWLFYQGNGYTHTPLTHGPLQFHLIALSYALFGDTDLAARIPHAIASVLGVLFLWNFRRYLGRTGTLVAAFLMLISPFMLYYGRYARNESLVVLFGLASIWAILRYLETGRSRYLLYLTAATALHFTAKETAFIYSAQALLFLTILLVQRVTSRRWQRPVFYLPFMLSTIIGFLLIGVGFTVAVINAATPADQAAPVPSFLILFPELLGVLALLLAVIFVIRGLGMPEIRRERAFNLAMLIGLLVLPQLTPIPVKYLGWDPLDYSPLGMQRTAMVLIPIVLLNIALGVWWNWRLFLANLAIFYSIFTVFYTTLFTYAAGFFTGLIGSLGYWLEQQGVQRGSQPWYYYLLIQVPVYEFLPLLGALFASAIILVRRVFKTNEESQAVVIATATIPAGGASPPEQLPNGLPAAVQAGGPGMEDAPVPGAEYAGEWGAFQPFTYPQEAPTLALLLFWAVTSLAAYTIAGEKMPWLTVHITLPLILLTGWGLGQLIDRINWRRILRQNGLLVLILLPLFTISLRAAFDLGTHLFTGAPVLPPEAPGLVAYTLFAVIAGGVLFYLLRSWHPAEFARFLLLTGFALLAVLTARASYQAAFIRYDEATEFLVYAHSAPSNKMLVDQIENLSLRVNGDLSLGVAFDNLAGENDPASAWPLTWYLRNFTTKFNFNPTVLKETPDQLLQYPVIFASDLNEAAVEPIVRNAYDSFNYIRMWWPMQDYFGLTWDRIASALSDPAMRSAILDIWLNRDYSAYARLTGQDLNLPNWQPSRTMRMFIRKDMSARVWERGTSLVAVELPVDPYAQGKIDLEALQSIGTQGTEPGQFQSPRGIAVAPDGTIFVADTGNHRIQHLTPDGDVLQVWGSYSGSDASLAGTAATGTFNEPWSIAVGPDGSVYVADTWNSRVQKFSSQGDYLASWGYFGTAETPLALWGPRGITVDANGRVFVSDTGNKRVVVFDAEGNPLSVIELGFNEPVGLTIGPDGQLYIADTWNQRVVVATELAENIFSFSTSWPLDGWYGESLDNKPYLAASPSGEIYATDPEGFRVLAFDASGEFATTWGSYGTTLDRFTLPSGVAVGSDGSVWVVDTASHRILQFQVPVR